MTSPIDLAFKLRGALTGDRALGPDCPTDELFAGYATGDLTATEHRRLEDHALVCAPCFDVVKQLATHAASETAPAPRVSVVARVVQRGLELLNPLEVVLRRLTGEGAEPALGAVRRAEPAAGDAAEVLVVQGPGGGLDELLIQFQADGLVRLQVRGDEPPPVGPGEISSVVLEVDGAPREKRPFTGEALAFAPQGHGHYRIRLVARAPGAEPRDLAEAAVELRA